MGIREEYETKRRNENGRGNEQSENEKYNRKKLKMIKMIMIKNQKLKKIWREKGKTHIVPMQIDK